MGGRRGYGPTHSQTLEKIFMGTPGIRILAPCSLDSPGDLLLEAILRDDDPVLFVENKLLYSLPVLGEEDLNDFKITKIKPIPESGTQLLSSNYAPAFNLSLLAAPEPSLTIAAYGYMADLCRQAAFKLAYEEEIFTELVVLSQLSPFTIDPILNSVRKTHRLLVVEEGTYTMGWGAEIIARTTEVLGQDLYNAARVASLDIPVPASGPLETAVLPDIEAIMQSIEKMV
jgi:pyruvate/2-oxoglutarate/acetoin dehydrogenase E1 component